MGTPLKRAGVLLSPTKEHIGLTEVHTQRLAPELCSFFPARSHGGPKAHWNKVGCWLLSIVRRRQMPPALTQPHRDFHILHELTFGR